MKSQRGSAVGERVNLLTLSEILVEKRKFVVLTTLLVLVISVAVSVLLPRWYRSKATILPPESATNQADIAGLMMVAGYQPAYIPTLTSPSEIYGAILRSVRVRDAVVDSLDLVSVYNVKNKEAARRKLLKRCKITVTREEIVEIACEDKDRSRAADISNLFVRELDRFNSDLRVTAARRVREFIEARIEETRLELEKAEQNLKIFKEETGAVLISEQTRVSIQTAADMYGKIAELEVSLERLRQFATDRSPEIIDIRSRIRALERKLAEMGYMQVETNTGSESTLFPKFSAAPDLEKRLSGLLRDVEIKRSVYGVLSEQYEHARIQEMKDTPTIQVLDRAEPSRGAWRPKRKVIVSVSTVCAFIVSCLVVLVSRSLSESGDPQSRQALSRISSIIAEDVQSLKRHLTGRGR
jgi:tyrosine-protein kinase Etk/Wzc